MSERTRWPADHVVHMSLDHADPQQSISVAQCDCGWLDRTPWPGEQLQLDQDQRVEMHWREVESLT